MATRAQRERTSAEGAFGTACAELASMLHDAGAERPYDRAREFLEDMLRDGWKYRPREPEPQRPREPVQPASTPVMRAWRERTLAEIARAQAEFEAREAGRTSA
jgi:hypothetical protein